MVSQKMYETGVWPKLNIKRNVTEMRSPTNGSKRSITENFYEKLLLPTLGIRKGITANRCAAKSYEKIY